MPAGVASWLARLRVACSPSAWGRWQASQCRLAGDPEPVRAAMRVLAQDVAGPRGLRLVLSIEVAQDLQGLWFLRSGLMQALAAERGERHARIVLAGVDDQFRASWPDAPVTRPAAVIV